MDHRSFQLRLKALNKCHGKTKKGDESITENGKRIVVEVGEMSIYDVGVGAVSVASVQ